MSATEPPLISIVIAAYNAEKTIERCLETILAQGYPAFETLVVDDGSTDRTASILRDHPDRHRFTTVKVVNGGQSRARNLGVEKARGTWLGFFDADCLLEAGCLEALAAGIEAGDDVASIGGVQRSPRDDSEFGKAIQRYLDGIGFMMEYGRKGEQAIAETRHNPSCCVLYRRAVFERLGGYDEGLWVGEDPDLDRRAANEGFRHLVQPRAVVRHYRSPDARAFGRKMLAYGRGQMMLVRRHGMHRLIHWVPVVVMSAAVTAAAGLALWPRATAIALLGTLVLAVFGLETRRRRSDLGGMAFYRLFTINLTHWMGGFLAELFAPRLPRVPSPHDFASPSTSRTVAEAGP